MYELWHASDWPALERLPKRARVLLRHKGSLTKALQKHFSKDNARISVENSEIETSSAHINKQLGITDKEILKRIVVLCLGSKPYVYAETYMPTWATEELPWLAELGKNPLGTYLFSLANVTRSEFSYSLMDLSQLELDIIFEQDLVLWARRSVFHVPGKNVDSVPLLVTEVFMQQAVPSIVSSSFSGIEHHC